MIERLVDDLRNTSKRNDKIKILKKYFDIDKDIAPLLARCYDPFEKFNVTTIKPTVNGFKDLSDCYDQFNKILTQISSRQVTGNIAKEIVIRFVNTLTRESQHLVSLILNKDLKCGIGPETINAAYPGLVEQFSVQLANKYSPSKKYDVDFFWGSTKLDGIRCIYQNKRPGVLLTREGHELVGFENIISDVETIVERMKDYDDFKNFNESEFFVDGELFSNTLDFNKIQGIVVSNKNIDLAKKKQIHLKVFAIGPVNKTDDMINFFDSKEIFKGLPNIEPLDYFKVNNDPVTIMAKTKELVIGGFEGLMLRHPSIPYEWKRSNSLLKSKLLHETEAELIIIDYKPGKPGTKFENILGSLTCRGTVTDPMFTDSKVKFGEFEVTTDVGTGFSDEERKDIMDNIDDYIGKEIVVNYQCMSQNSSDDKYSLRFAVKKDFKLDRTADI
jgi:ATP-dependent DNA ligase